MICSKSPQPLSHIHICPKPKFKLSPTDLIYPAPPSSFDIASSVSPIGISVSLRWDCKLSVSLRNVSVQPRWAIGPTEFAMQTLCFPFVTFWSHRHERFGPIEFAWPTLWLAYYQNWSHWVHLAKSLFPYHNILVPPKWAIAPTEFAWPTLCLINC